MTKIICKKHILFYSVFRGTMPEENIFELFKKDHNLFIRIFNNGIKNLCATNNYKIAHQLWTFCNLFLENYHHETEELALFKKVAENPRIKNGGPMCTYYYDVQIANNPLMRVYRELGINAYCIQPEHIPERFKVEFNNKLPIVIPLEEHIAGKLLLKEIQCLLSKEQNMERIIRLFKMYYEIQLFHFKKEESCFFEMCANLLSPEDLAVATTLANLNQRHAKSEYRILINTLEMHL